MLECSYKAETRAYFFDLKNKQINIHNDLISFNT